MVEASLQFIGNSVPAGILWLWLGTAGVLVLIPVRFPAIGIPSPNLNGHVSQVVHHQGGKVSHVCWLRVPQCPADLFYVGVTISLVTANDSL